MDKKGVLYFNVSSQQTSDPTTKLVFSSEDVGTALLECHLIKNGLPWTLPPQSVGVIQLTMADGTKYTDNTDPLQRVNGMATYTLSSVQLKHVGKAEGILMISKGSERLTTQSFSVIIESSGMGGGIIGNGVPDIKFSVDKKGNLLLTHGDNNTLDFRLNPNGELEVKTWQ